MRALFKEFLQEEDLSISSECYLSQNDVSKCIPQILSKGSVYHDKALKMYQRVNSDTGDHGYSIARTINLLGIGYFFEGEALKKLRGEENQKKGKEYCNKGLKYCEEALEMRKKIYNDNPRIADSLSTLGELYRRMGDAKKGLEFSKKGLEMREKLYDKHPSIAKSLDDIGSCHKDLGDKKQALDCYKKAYFMRKELYGENDSDTQLYKENILSINPDFFKHNSRVKGVLYGARRPRIKKAEFCDL